MGAGLQEGVVGTNGGAYKVTLSSGMILTIAASTADGAMVQGDTIAAQGLYFVPPHSAAITETVTAAHATLPRIDMVVLEVLDANHDGGASNLARTRIIAGTATSGATLDNRTGAAALPNTCMLLADVLVPAAAASILAANIRDRRRWAAGAFYRVQRTAGSYAITATSLAEVDTTNLKPRIECSGNPMRVRLGGVAQHGSVTFMDITTFVDAARPADAMVERINATVVTTDINVSRSWTIIPASGSHFISLAAATPGGGTLTIRGENTVPIGLEFEVEEIVRANANNT